VRELTDLQVAASEIWRGNLTLFDYLRSICPPVELAMFALDDPMPAVCDVPILLYQMGNGWLK
jgi:predicted ATP-grasp superfamily ATP-dependent carboligase